MNKLFTLGFLVLVCCTPSKKREHDNAADRIAIKTSTPTTLDWIDSLLAQPDTTKIILLSEDEKFIKLSSDSKFIKCKHVVIRNHLAAEWGLDTSFVHNEHWLDFQTADGHLKILGSAGTDNSALWLVTFDNHQKAVDRYEISGGECSGGWDEYEGKFCSCQFKMATQINDSTFVIRKLWECKKDWNAKSHFEKLNKWIIYIKSGSKIIERLHAKH